jgi:DNA-binding protein HU-beta
LILQKACQNSLNGVQGLILARKLCVWSDDSFRGKVRVYFAGRIFAKFNTKGSPMSKPMTKTQLVAAIAEAMGSDKKTANAALDAIATVVAQEVAGGGSITLPGLGKVACKARPERMVRNPATGEQMKKPADKQVKFAIAKALKDVVNG